MEEKLIDLTLTSDAVLTLIEGIELCEHKAGNEYWVENEDMYQRLAELKTLKEYLESSLTK